MLLYYPQEGMACPQPLLFRNVGQGLVDQGLRKLGSMGQELQRIKLGSGRNALVGHGSVG